MLYAQKQWHCENHCGDMQTPLFLIIVMRNELKPVLNICSLNSLYSLNEDIALLFQENTSKYVMLSANVQTSMC